mmetsp:Transcript_23925/g.32908  ORF Transcript_23925/g.32908 Transcript_23925/m.32908 type:complete len:489 (-) Transcript_23925:239-1705(-)
MLSSGENIKTLTEFDVHVRGMAASMLDKYETAVTMMQQEDVMIQINRKLAAEQRTNEKMRSQLKASTNDNLALQQQLSAIQRQLLSKENELLCVSERNQVLKSAHEQEVADRKKTEQDLRATIAAADHKVGALEMSAAEQQRGLRRLREVTKLLEAKEVLVHQYETQLSQTMQNLEDVCGTNSDLRNKVDRLKAQRESQTQELHALMIEKKDLLRRLEDAEASNTRLRIVGGMYSEQKVELEKEVDILEGQCDHKQLLLQRHQARVNELLVREAKHYVADRMNLPPRQFYGSSSRPLLQPVPNPAPHGGILQPQGVTFQPPTKACIRPPLKVEPLRSSPRQEREPLAARGALFPASQLRKESHPPSSFRDSKKSAAAWRGLPRLVVNQPPPTVYTGPSSSPKIPSLHHGVARPTKFEDIVDEFKEIDKTSIPFEANSHRESPRKNIEKYDISSAKKGREILANGRGRSSIRHIPSTNLSNIAVLDKAN